MIRHLCSLKEFGPYLCMVSRSRFFGKLMIMMASNGHFCRNTMLLIMLHKRSSAFFAPVSVCAAGNCSQCMSQVPHIGQRHKLRIPALSFGLGCEEHASMHAGRCDRRCTAHLHADSTPNAEFL